MSRGNVWLRPLALSRGRLALTATLLSICALAWGGFAVPFLEDYSTSHGQNIAVMAAQFGLWMGAGWFLAAAVGAHLWGDVWRRRVLLGQRTTDVLAEETPDGPELSAFNDRVGAFWALAALATLGLFGVSFAVYGHYVGTYSDSGFYRTMLRHPDAAERIRGLRAVVDPLQPRASQNPAIRSAVVAALQDPDPNVQTWAAWAVGHRLYVEGRPGLVPLLRGDNLEAFVEAAHALGRLSDAAGERALLERLPEVLDDAPRRTAVLTGLGLMSSRSAAVAVTALAPQMPDDGWAPAMWVVSRGRTTEVRDALIERIDEGDLARRCATAEALKQATTTEDYEDMRRRYSSTPREEDCAAVRAPDRRYRDDEAVDDFVYVPAEPLRRKYLIAAFNIGGPGLEDWLQAIAWDEREELSIRLLAENLHKLLRSSPARLPRR